MTAIAAASAKSATAVTATLFALRVGSLSAFSAWAAATKPSGSGVTGSVWRVSRSMSRRLMRSSGLQKAIARAIRAGARGAADAVDILLGNVGQVEVDDMGDARDVDPARGDVGRDQDRRLAGLEGGDGALALGLRLVAVDRGGGDAGGAQAGGRSCRRHAWSG